MKPKLIAFLNSYTEGVSGGDIRFIEIAKRINAFDKTVITSAEGRKMCESGGLNATYVITTKETHSRNILITYFGRILKALFLKMEIYDGDILYSTSDFLPDVLPAFVLKLRNGNAKWVVSVYHLIPHPLKRSGDFISNTLSYVTQHLSLRLVKNADLIQTETTLLKQRLIHEYRIPSRKILAVQSGIAPEIIDSVNWDEKVYDACFLARLHRSKGIFDLIEAWRLVCNRYENAKLAVGGSGSAEIIERLEHKIDDLKLSEKVTILGFLSTEEKYKLLKASKLYVLPSYEEGIPITFYEAMYCGLPVVTYYLPTYTEIKDYIVKVTLGNVEKLSEEVIRFLEDEDLVRMLGERGRSFAKEHTWDKVAEYIISQIERIST